MALPPISSTPVPQVRTGESTAARAAQRAFFNAALGGASAPAAPQPVAAVAPAPPPRAATPQVQAQPETAELNRTYRPGSRLDIRV